MSFMGGGNGQWARARNNSGAKSYASELKNDRERRQAQAARAKRFRQRTVARISRMWSKLLGR